MLGAICVYGGAGSQRKDEQMNIQKTMFGSWEVFIVAGEDETIVLYEADTYKEALEHKLTLERNK